MFVLLFRDKSNTFSLKNKFLMKYVFNCATIFEN